MILVFLVLILIVIIALLVFILSMSNIKIKIEKLQISNISGKFKALFISKIGIFVFNKFKIFEIKIDDKKVKDIFKNRKLNIKKLKYNDTVRLIKNYEVYLEKLNIDGYLGLEDAAYTAYSVSLINIIIGFFLASKIYSNNKSNYRYNINPLYLNQNLVNIEINCIISIKIVNIISMILSVLKKGRVSKNERTSNRRAYAYSNE